MGKKMCFTGKNNICLQCILLGVEKKEMGVELKWWRKKWHLYTGSLQLAFLKQNSNVNFEWVVFLLYWSIMVNL